MCNNVYKWFLRAFAVVAVLTVTSCAESPDKDDIVIPECTLSIDGTTVDKGSAATIVFDEKGGTRNFSIQTTGEWEIEDHENAPQGFVLTTSKGEKYSGKGDETFTVMMSESTTSSDFSLKIKVYASIFGQKKLSDSRSIRIMQNKEGSENPSPDESGTITMTAADIAANGSGTTTLDVNGYGSQKVDDASTYYTWKMNNVTFAGAKICIANSEQAEIYEGLIQMQGNASDAAKQGFFGNTYDLKKINKVVVVSKNTKYEPTEHLYVGTSAFPLGQNAVTRADMTTGEDGQTYTETFNISGEYGFFALANDKQGALYVESVTVYYGDEGVGGDTPTPPTPSTGTMTVAELVAKCKDAGSTQTVLDAENDVVVEAVIVTDKDGGNTKTNNLMVMAEGATEPGNGVLLFGSGVTDPTAESFAFKSGDKVKLTLIAGKARVCTYNGTYEVTGSKGVEWITIEKIGTATITPVEVTVDKLAEYQSMVVTVKDATSPAAAAEWCTADSPKKHIFTAGGSDFEVYVQPNAADFVGKQFKASTTGDITGVVLIYNNVGQLAPRTADDVKAFNGEGGGEEPTPSTPSTMTVAELVAKCKAAGSTNTVINADSDVEVEAVIVTDKDGGNFKFKNLMIMAEGATEPGNGLLLYGDGITNPGADTFAFKSGDKVKVTLTAGKALACTYNGMYEIQGDATDWIKIEKIGTATITPVEITTVDNLLEYQSMVVTVKDATSPAAAAEWTTVNAIKKHIFTVGGSELEVYVQKNAADFVGKQFKASTTGDITGTVMVYSGVAQLAPRTADDVKAFNGEGGGEPDQPNPPAPAEGTTVTYTPSQLHTNSESVSSVPLNEGAVTLGFAKGTNSNNAPKYYDKGMALRCYGGNTITVSSTSKISKIVVVRSAGDDGNTLLTDVGSLSDDTLTWTGESNEVVLTVSGSKGNIRIASMEITYGE